ncbi:ribonucleoside-triphosphate reductase, adenosylcobalamin-dependent [Schleiferilactobacillus shenzhenensis]|uniref:Adenosylcobalamin-dependent ribonucleoside-triphosphate reductase n=1 Tax=Schleiferilactobacillus shenzhenensis LY-73 TaxID=1231336 RepID=U4TK96_9LACO|nr:ribonucleoside-triphosphate reductase, adenosylcobalamin-dependent [Schleiferilactobacillus shenzhenensis]ERL64624.1 RtpR [Schleiferilactobacillus shenzhenensis LY-73]
MPVAATQTKTVITLPQDYVDQIKATVQPHWGPLGWVTYKRTYARWLPDQKRTENWDETVKRVVEGNINLDPRLHQADVDPAVVAALSQEARDLFKLVYGLAATPSGRNLWISGTDYQKRNGDALNNCWFIAVRPQPYGASHIVPLYLQPDQPAVSMPYSFMFDELMKGGGVGFSVVQDNIRQIPAVAHAIDLTVVISKNSASYADVLKLGAVDKDDWLAQHDASAGRYYTLPDTREGWVLANANLIDLHFASTNPEGLTQLVLDVSHIRPKGARIHGFGGTASGPMPLIEMLYDINSVLNAKAGARLTAVDATDIGNLIGKTVVAGNVRRSAEMALGSADDQDFITMKQDKQKLYHHRWASNNSVAVDSDFDGYAPVAAAIAKNGEPGIVNLALSQHYGRLADGARSDADPTVEGTNPCGEISLANGEPCNLFEVFPYVAGQQHWDLPQVFRLATRFAKRVTFSPYDWAVSRRVIQKNRRIGISISGVQDWFLHDFGGRVVTGFAADGTPRYDPRIVRAVDGLYQSVVQADRDYSAALGCQPSIKHTTVKPSGTVAKLAGVSEGMHFHYAGYLIQRIRFQDNDPLLPALKACGYHIEPDVYTKNTMCVEFPIRAAHADSPSFASAGTVAIAEQFATQAFLQKYWSDNAVSCTITFQPKEAAQIAPLLRQYRHAIKSTSLLPYIGAGFKQAPKEPIDKATYEDRKAAITDDVAAVFAAQNDNHDKKDIALVDQTDCAGGACPVK